MELSERCFVLVPVRTGPAMLGPALAAWTPRCARIVDLAASFADHEGDVGDRHAAKLARVRPCVELAEVDLPELERRQELEPEARGRIHPYVPGCFAAGIVEVACLVKGSLAILGLGAHHGVALTGEGANLRREPDSSVRACAAGRAPPNPSRRRPGIARVRARRAPRSPRRARTSTNAPRTAAPDCLGPPARVG